MSFVLKSASFSLSCHKLLNPNNLVLRRISIFGKIKEAPVLLDKTNYKTIYHFKYVIFPAGVSKAKYKLPIISIPLISGCFYFNQPQLATLLVIGSFLQFALMFAISRISENIIGKIYVNKDGKINDVIISSIDSNGNRKDERFSPDMFSLSEHPLTARLGFLNLETECNKKFKINMKSAHIKDEGALRIIFEDLVFFNVKSTNKKS